MKTILIPIDFSPATPAVIDTAVRLAEGDTTRLVLLNVVRPEPVISGEFAESEVAGAITRDAEAHAAAGLAQLQERLRTQGFVAHTLHRTGSVVPEIVEQAQRLEADFIVMGSHGHGALYELFVGSTTQGVLKHATCPVVIVPPAGKTTPASDTPTKATGV
jgi:universal stress protein A